MENTQKITYDNIIKIVHNWPLSIRLTLIQDVLKTITPEIETFEPNLSRTKQGTLNDALGLLATGQSVPSDDMIQGWIS